MKNIKNDALCFILSLAEIQNPNFKATIYESLYVYICIYLYSFVSFSLF